MEQRLDWQPAIVLLQMDSTDYRLIGRFSAHIDLPKPMKKMGIKSLSADGGAHQ